MWATAKKYKKPWNESMVHLHTTKPRKTKKTPWWHTNEGACAFLSTADWTELTGRKPDYNNLIKVRLEVVE